MSASVNVTKQRSGQLGGCQTLARHGREHFARAGRLGGRGNRRTPASDRRRERQGGTLLGRDSGPELTVRQMRRVFADLQHIVGGYS